MTLFELLHPLVWSKIPLRSFGNQQKILCVDIRFTALSTANVHFSRDMMFWHSIHSITKNIWNQWENTELNINKREFSVKHAAAQSETVPFIISQGKWGCGSLISAVVQQEAVAGPSSDTHAGHLNESPSHWVVRTAFNFCAFSETCRKVSQETFAAAQLALPKNQKQP